MNWLNPKKWFKSSVGEHYEISAASIQFTGSPNGNGLKVLTDHLSKELQKHPEAGLAFLAIARYGNDKTERLVLCFKAGSSSAKLAKCLGNVCSSLFDRSSFVDIMPFEDLPESSQRQLLSVCPPFYGNL